MARKTLIKTSSCEYDAPRSFSVCGLRGTAVSVVLSARKVVGSNPPMVGHTLCRSPRLAPGYLADAREIYA